MQSIIFVALVLVSTVLIVQRLEYVADGLRRQFGGFSGDFYAFYGAGVLYNERRDASMYHLDELRATQYRVFPHLNDHPNWTGGEVTPFRNPPFFLPFVGYLASFRVPVAFVFLSPLIAGLIGITVGLTGTMALKKTVPVAVLGWAGLALAAYHTWYGVFWGQVPSYIAAVGLTLGILALRSQHMILGGLALSLLGIKPQYAVPIVVFLIAARYWKALLAFTVGGITLLAVSVALVGLGGMIQYAVNIWEVASAPANMYTNEFQDMYNWRGLLEHLFAGQSSLIALLQFPLILITYGLAVWAWLAPKRDRLWHDDARYVVLVLLMLVASPHAHAQDLVLLLPAAALIAYHTWGTDSPWPLTAISAIGLFVVFWLLPQSAILGPSFHAGALLLVLLFGASVVLLRSRLAERIGHLLRSHATTTIGQPTAVSDGPS